MKKSTEISTYAQMGMAALLPGMQYMIERMQAELDEMRLFLARLQNGAQGRAEKQSRSNSGIVAYWAKMTPAERSAEMKRRQAKAKGGHPSNPAHPKHAQWVEKKRQTLAAKQKAVA